MMSSLESSSSTTDVEKCPICLEPLHSLPDQPAIPEALRLLFVPEKCCRHWMHAACARGCVKADRIEKRTLIGCPLCRMPYSQQDLKCLLPPRRKITYQTEVSPIDDTSDYRIILYEHYNPIIMTSSERLPNTTSTRLCDYTFSSENLPPYHEVYVPVRGTQRLVLDRVIIEPPPQQQQRQQQQQPQQQQEVLEEDNMNLEALSLRNVMTNFRDLRKNIQTLGENMSRLKLYHSSNRLLQHAVYSNRLTRQRVRMEQQLAGRRTTRSVTRTLSSLTRNHDRRIRRHDQETDLLNNLESRIASMKGVIHGFRSTLLDFMLLSPSSR